MNYNDSYIEFQKYIQKCQELIKRTIFTKKDSFELNVANNCNINEVITEHRLKMIDRKIKHTMRMIEQIIKVNQSMDFKFNFCEVMKVAILYHDIGRFRQATWSNTFSDGIYKKFNSSFNNHGEDGYDIFIHNDFKVLDKYIPVIGISILHHLDHKKIKELNYKFSTPLSKFDVDSIVTGNFNLNSGELEAASLIVGLVADIDKLDILYQHLSDDFEMIKDYVLDRSMNDLDSISLYWKISKEEIIEYNQIDEKEYIPRVIRIPVKNMALKKLEVNSFYKDCFYSGIWPSLSELRERVDWTFITALWWRLSVFLNQIDFYSTLESVSITDLIPRIFECIPNIYKPLLQEAFEYAQNELVIRRLKDNKGRIYLKY